MVRRGWNNDSTRMKEKKGKKKFMYSGASGAVEYSQE